MYEFFVAHRLGKRRSCLVWERCKPLSDKESRCTVAGNQLSTLALASWNQRVVTRYQFEDWGLDYGALVPKLYEKGYIKGEKPDPDHQDKLKSYYRVNLEFKELDRDFKLWFPKYTKGKFKLIENILLSTRQTVLVQEWGRLLDRDWQWTVDGTFANGRSAHAAGSNMETMLKKYEPGAAYFCVAEPRQSRDFHLHVLIKGMSLVNTLSLVYEWCWRYGRAEMQVYDSEEGKRFYNSKNLGSSEVEFLTNIKKDKRNA